MSQRCERPLEGMRICPLCGGEGTREYFSRTSLDRSDVKCEPCDGSGQVAARGPRDITCPMCKGLGAPYRGSVKLCDGCEGRGLRTLSPPAGEPGTQDDAGPRVITVVAGKPATAHFAFASLVEDLHGELRICDPYFGSGSLIRLHELAGRSIKFLTSKVESTDKAGGVFADRLSEFKVEHPTLEVRKNAGRELHDRYILSEDSLVLLGHGLKDIGKKDSFVVRLGKDQVGDVISDLAAAFDDKWAKAEVVA